MSAEASAGHAIPREVEQAIERQRAQLMRVSTVLTCLWISTLYQKWHDVEIEADDVALLLRRVIDEAVDALDIVVLARAAENSDDGLERDDDLLPDEDSEPDDGAESDDDEGDEDADDD